MHGYPQEEGGLSTGCPWGGLGIERVDGQAVRREELNTVQLSGGFLLAVVVAAGAYAASSLSRSGAIAAVVVGTLTFGVGGVLGMSVADKSGTRTRGALRGGGRGGTVAPPAALWQAYGSVWTGSAGSLPHSVQEPSYSRTFSNPASLSTR